MNLSKSITYYNTVRKINLSKDISSKIFEFIHRKINIKDFEQWIYNCDQLSDELDCDEYLKLIEFNFQSKDAYYSLDKILYELLDRYIVEQKNEIVVSGIKVSEIAYDMLLAGKIVDTIKRRDEIVKVFEDEGIPVFDKVIDFQEQFGGIWYKIGEKFYKGFEMDMFYYHDFEEKYVFKDVIKKDGRYLFGCMDYHYSGDSGPYIDEDGKIYYCGMGAFPIAADSIEEFLDDEAIKFYLASKHSSWLERRVKLDEIDYLKKANRLIKIERESFTDKYFGWWSNTEETVFIRIDLAKTCSYAKLYCENQEILNQVYKWRGIQGRLKYIFRSFN